MHPSQRRRRKTTTNLSINIYIHAPNGKVSVSGIGHQIDIARDRRLLSKVLIDIAGSAVSKAVVSLILILLN